MRSSLSRWSVGAVLGALLFGISGCKGGASSPTDWLSWGKKPSPTALSSTAPRKPSAPSLPNPRATTGGQTGLANNSYTNYGNQGYPATSGSSSPNGYNTGPYGMASQSTAGSLQSGKSPYGLASATGGSPYAPNTNTPYSGPASPYSSSVPAQPNAYAGSDSTYRSADARSATLPYSNEPTANAYSGQPYSNEPTANAYGGQQSTYSSGQSNYAQPATQNWETQSAPGYPATGATGTTGLSNSVGPYQPGSTNSSGALPTNGGTTNLQGSASTNHPARTGYAGSARRESGSYQPAPAGQLPATPANTFPTTGSSAYPATSGAGQGYLSPYPNSGY